MYRSDSDLVETCLDGDERSWKEIVGRYARLVYSIPHHYGLSLADADAVFQNVFANLNHQLDKLRDHQRLSTWLIQATYHETQVIHKRTAPATKLEPFATNGHLPPEQVETWERQHWVHQALDQLEKPCYELLASWFIESKKCSPAELAAQLGMDVKSVLPARARCFKKLDTILKDMDVDLSI